LSTLIDPGGDTGLVMTTGIVVGLDWMIFLTVSLTESLSARPDRARIYTPEFIRNSLLSESVCFLPPHKGMVLRANPIESVLQTVRQL
jgi:hypothetical protein